MNEPNDVVAPEPVDSTDPSVPPVVEPPAAPAYGTYVAPPVLPPSAAPATPSAAAGDPLRGVLAGVIAAVVGAALWALLVAITHYEIGIAAVVVGAGVGWAVHRFGGVASIGLAVTAAGLAAVGILLGFVLASLFVGAHQLGIGVFDALDLVSSEIGWTTFVTDSVDGMGWLFLAIGALGAFRLVAQQRRTR